MQRAVQEEPTAQDVVPDLRIVPVESLIPHEEHDPQRAAPLIERIRAAGTWLNPPVVAPLDAQRYVILDGANRHYALKTLGYPHILVQVVNYESSAVQLETWHHVISGMSWFEFLRNLREIKTFQIESTDLLSARAALARREVLAYTVLSDNRAYTLNADVNTLAARTAVLREMVDTYKSRGVLNRINTDSISMARRLYPEAVAIVVFPRYHPAEIMVAARDGIYLPPGISRHIIYGRAMRLNYPLSALAETGETLAEKNEALRRWIQQRVAERRVRYYAEPTYLFDE
ncbi:MAG: ParB N-terminal domain-containing protein [Anaerolineae bacterium]|nr:ParB N-terminal domain-containing protein [Anaerolineae bacterium]MDW8299654.1 ParB N-terminal domain-containing protein [Anaerolineae bacterium]